MAFQQMIPTRNQYKKWSLPSKWSFWAAVIGIPLGILSLALGVVPFLRPDTAGLERNRLLLRVAQELRYNDEWLSEVALAVQGNMKSIPPGSLKTDALISFIQNDFELVTRNTYGEEKHIYQEAFKLKDVGQALGLLKSPRDVEVFNHHSEYRVHDVHFLNNFFYWYLWPLIEKELDGKQLYSLGWKGPPRDKFKVEGLKAFDMKKFTHDYGKPLTEFSVYLGFID